MNAVEVQASAPLTGGLVQAPTSTAFVPADEGVASKWEEHARLFGLEPAPRRFGLEPAPSWSLPAVPMRAALSPAQMRSPSNRSAFPSATPVTSKRPRSPDSPPTDALHTQPFSHRSLATTTAVPQPIHKRPRTEGSVPAGMAASSLRDRPPTVHALGGATNQAVPAGQPDPLTIELSVESKTKVTEELYTRLLKRDDLLVQNAFKVVHLLKSVNPGIAGSQPTVAYDRAAFDRTSQLNGATAWIDSRGVHDKFMNHLKGLTEEQKAGFRAEFKSIYDALLWLNDKGFAPSLKVLQIGMRSMAENDSASWTVTTYRPGQPAEDIARLLERSEASGAGVR